MASLISTKNIDESSSNHDATTSSPSYVILDQPLSSGTSYNNQGDQPPESIDDFSKQTPATNMDKTECESNSDLNGIQTCLDCCLCCTSFCELLGTVSGH